MHRRSAPPVAQTPRPRQNFATSHTQNAASSAPARYTAAEYRRPVGGGAGKPSGFRHTYPPESSYPVNTCKGTSDPLGATMLTHTGGRSAGTPGPVIARLNAEAVKALQSDEMREKLALDGAQPVGSSPAEFGALIKSELEKWSRVARAAGIEPQ